MRCVWLCLFWIMAACLGQQAAAGASPDRGVTELLDVVINHRDTGRVGRFRCQGAYLRATAGELASLGLRTMGHDPAAEVSLGSLPGVRWRIDARTQTLYLAAAAAALAPAVLTASDRGDASALPVRGGVGAVLNYDVAGTYVLGRGRAGLRRLAEAELDGRVFSPLGVLSSLVVAGNATGHAGAAFRRLQTSYSYADPGSLRTWHAGDLVSSGLGWSRPVRMAGGQIGTDFATRPDLVTFPVPTITGQVAVPSSIDVLVDGVQLLSRTIQPGPFGIRQLPLIDGAGDVDVVVRDAAGVQSSRTLPVYASNLLLRRGLTAYSAELGVVRLDYGAPDDRYGAAAGSVSLRHGLLDWLTLEAHAEATAGTTAYGVRSGSGGLGGGSVLVTLGQLGALSLDAAASRMGHRRGGLLAASFERVTRRLTVSGFVQRTSRGYGDIASANGDPVPRLQLRASLGAPMGRLGALGLAFVHIDRPGPGALYAGDAAAGAGGLVRPGAEHVSLLSASVTRPLLGGRAALFATGFHGLGRRAGTGVSLGITIALGARDTAAAGVADTGGHAGGTLEYDRADAAIGDAGWRLRDDAGAPSRQYAVGEYRLPEALVGAGIDREDGRTALRGTAQGALVVADGGVFAANTIHDSFAVVDTGGVAHVPVLQENRLVGLTDGSGRMLVADLRSFDANRIGIDPTGLAADVQVGSVEQLVRPRDRSGVVVRFAVRPGKGALVALVDARGAPITVGSQARLGRAAAAHEVGFGGEVFLTGLADRDTLAVTLPDGQRCRASFAYRPAAGRLPRIGPVPCLALAA